MNAKDKAIIQLSEAAGALALHAVAQHTREAMEKIYMLGFDAGKIAGIEEGKATATAIISGLRALLGLADGTAELPLPFTPHSITPVTAAELPRSDTYLAGKSEPRELVDLATGEIFEESAATVRQLLDAVELTVPAEQKADDKLLDENPGVNFPGYSPLDVPVGDCSICQGFGVIEGELYGAPCMIPCTCTAGEQVKALGEVDLVAINGNWFPGDPKPAGLFSGAQADEIPEVKIPEAKVEELAEIENSSDVECLNEACQFYNDTFLGGCSVPPEDRAGHPLGDCPNFLATAPEKATAAPDYECCRLCSLPDPDCSACGLIDHEINARGEAGAKPAEVPKCGNRSCPATAPGAKEVCLRITIEGRPGKECRSFVPLETAPDPTAEQSPMDAKKAALQAKCPHPADFMNVAPGRGEVCTICDLVLTPETLPLFEEKPAAPCNHHNRRVNPKDMSEYCDDCGHITRPAAEGRKAVEPKETPNSIIVTGQEDVVEEEIELIPGCEHPAELRLPSPEIKNGEKIGSIVTCGGCKKVIARFDNDRKPVPPELWPENGGALDAADIRRHGYKPSELKMIKAGFSLIRYDRDDKNLYRTCKDPALGRFLVLHGKTYADCERHLAEELKDPKLVQVDASGNAADRHAEAKLRAAGFEFYRFEKSSPGVSPKIKVGSKNWGMLAKYKADAELAVEWKKLMNEDPLALQG